MTTENNTIDNSEPKFSSPNDAVTYVQSLLVARKYKESISVLQSAKKKWVKNPTVAGLLAEAFGKTGDSKSALEVYNDLIATGTAPYWVYVGYANVLEKMHRHDEAVENFFIALDLHYAESVIQRIVRLLKYASSRKTVVTELSGVLGKLDIKKAELAKLYCSLGDYAVQEKDHRAAIDLYELAIKKDGGYKKAHCRKIKEQIRLREHTEASQSIKDWNVENSGDKAFVRFEKIINYNERIAPYMRALGNIFVPGYYKTTYDLCELNNTEVFKHFINVGLEKKYNPNPWFSSEYFEANHAEVIQQGEVPLIAYLRLENSLPVKPSSGFDPKDYRMRHHDIHDQPSAFEHYCRFGHIEGRTSIKRILPNVVLDEFNEMAKLEPKLVSARKGLNTIVRYPRVVSSIFLPQIVRKRITSDIKAIVCVPFISHGGADLVATVALKALQNRYGIKNVLLLVTESKDTNLECWFDEDTPIVFLDRECGYENIEDKILTLHDIIGQFNPISILNVNSNLCWELFRNYGKQLSSVTSLFAYLFCYDFNKERNRVGYISEYLADTIDNLTSVFFDNVSIVKDIESSYVFSDRNQSKLKPIYTPYIKSTVKAVDSDSNGDILWIGRLSDQKRPDVLVKIAESMPSRTFCVYGAAGNSEISGDIVNERIDNIRFMGTYDLLSEINLSKYSLFLHTSEWEGLPTILITMMAIGMPIVTSIPGGVGELVDDASGWVVKEFDDIDSYCRTINQVTLNYAEALVKSKHGMDRIDSEFNWSDYEERLAEKGLYEKLITEENLKISADCLIAG